MSVSGTGVVGRCGTWQWDRRRRRPRNLSKYCWLIKIGPMPGLEQIKADQRSTHYDATQHWNALLAETHAFIHSINASNSERVTINLLVWLLGRRTTSPSPNFRYVSKPNWSDDPPDKWQLQKLATDHLNAHSIQFDFNFDFGMLFRVCEHLLFDFN